MTVQYTMITEQERRETAAAATAFRESLRPMEYLSPDSYRDLLKDAATRETFVTLANMLWHIKRAYCD
jgi:hypothetical protein